MELVRVCVRGALALASVSQIASFSTAFAEVRYLSQIDSTEVEPTLIGGTVVDHVKEFPASVYVSMDGGRCSGTIVGSRVMVFAAHCVKNGGQASFTVPATGEKYTARCTNAPDYLRGINSADWSLCLVDRPVTGIPFEVLNSDPARHAKGVQLQLTGYGCINPGGGGGNDGKFRVGNATVTQVPAGRNYDIVTVGKAALCFGDSGGAAFAYLDAEGKTRVQVSINSKGNISTTSYISSTANPVFQEFASGWTKTNGVTICGINPEATGCRGVTPPAPPAPKHQTKKYCEAPVAAVEGAVFGPDYLQADAVEVLIKKLASCLRSPKPLK